MYRQGKYVITSKKEIANGIYDITVKCPEIADDAQSGQFAQVYGTIRLVFEVRGKGTKQLSSLNEGDMLDIIAPLGNGFKVLPKGKKAVCIGGGIGTPPMLSIAKEYKDNATVISGFRSADAVILQDDFKSIGCDTILCTDDGTAGIHGFVTEALKAELEKAKPDIIYACGPMPMLKAIVAMADEYEIETQVSLEQRMACGVGACLVCVCRTVKDGKEILSHVCKDGPVFDSKEVDFNG